MEVKNVLEIYEKKRERVQEFKRIVERVNFYKIQRKGVDIMCEITDRIRREGKIEGRYRRHYAITGRAGEDTDKDCAADHAGDRSQCFGCGVFCLQWKPGITSVSYF